MTDDTDAILDDILARWHDWQMGEKLGKGHNRQALVCGDFKVSRQYDDISGKLDDDLEAIRSKQVDHEVRQMADPHRTAIYLDARNICNGLSDWDSPRLPILREERILVVRFARRMLTQRLVSAGVM